ncbi:hypothetical protein VCRA2122O129_150151 [Vibrio crassostreae]|nr:hypothetical protein VCRA2122O129_150151 [Vibrio crassostreae]
MRDVTALRGKPLKVKFLPSLIWEADYTINLIYNSDLNHWL